MVRDRADGATAEGETAGEHDRTLVASLLSAIVRADGDALVMHVGECPYVVAVAGVVELSSEPVTLAAMTRMLDRLLPPAERASLEVSGAVQHELTWAEADGERYRLVAAWGGDDIWTEIRRYRREMADGLDPAFEAAPNPEARSEGEAEPRPAMTPAADVGEAPADEPAGVVVPIQRADGPPQAEAADRAVVGLDELIRQAGARRASTLYLVTQSRPVLRIDGELAPLESVRSLEAFEVEALFQELASGATGGAVSRGASAREWTRHVSGVGRVRCVAFRDRRGPGLICRIVPERTASAADLGLSQAIRNLVSWPDGLIVVTGQRLSGKSTLISALVDLIGTTRGVHVVMLERQLRFVHENGGSFISQREVRGDGTDMAAAVRTALREDPDVLVVDDMRSGETMTALLGAAESGRLVIGALPAAGTVVALERILGHVPADRRLEYRRMLSGTLRGAIAQVLLRKTGGGRLAARELLLNTPRVAEAIAEDRLFDLPGALDAGRQVGMVPMNDALAAFVQRGAAEARVAYRAATDREGLLQALRRAGVDTSFVERRA